MKPKTCQGCPLQYKTEGYVFGEGPDDATVCLVGEALGAEEARYGRPFIGGAGRTLNFFLRKAELRRSDMYVTNIVKCRPPHNRKPTQIEARECMRRHKMLDFLSKFNVVVLMGNTALQGVTGEQRISRFRGCVWQHQFHTGKRIKVLPTLHPAAIMRQQEMIPVAVSDLQKVQAEMRTPEWEAPVQDYALQADAKEIHELTQAKLPIAFDVETNSLTPGPRSITMLGISNEAGRVFVIRNIHDAHVQQGLRKLFAQQITMVGHNVMFDVSHLEANGVPVHGKLFDTMLAHHMVLSDVPNDLGFVSSLYTRMPPWKHLMRKDLAYYNACDVDATFRLYQYLSAQIESMGAQRPFQISLDLMRPLHEMTNFGIRFDNLQAAKWRVGLERSIRKNEELLNKLVGKTVFNWRSTQQLAKLLYDDLNLPEQINRKSGSRTTNAKALEAIYELTKNKVVGVLLKLRKQGKLASTYFNPPESADGRVHSHYLIHGTGTGRLSSANPNLQNVPKGPARAIYVPDDGHVFVSADYSQIEIRIAAILAGEKKLLEAFDAGVDIHRAIAAEVYDKPMDKITDRDRFLAKTIVYGLGYGRGAVSLAAMYKLSLPAARAFIAKYFATYSHIAAWRESVLGCASKRGYLVTPFGRRRYFFGPNIAPKVYNFLPQGTAADIIGEALVRVHHQLPSHARLLLQIHDELVVQCEEGKEKEVTECLKDVMEGPVDVLGMHCFPVNTAVGKNWQEVS